MHGYTAIKQNDDHNYSWMKIENHTIFWYDDHTVFSMIIGGLKSIPFFFAVSAWVWILLCRCMMMRLMMDNPDSLCLLKECRELEEGFGTNFTDMFLLTRS